MPACPLYNPYHLLETLVLLQKLCQRQSTCTGDENLRPRLSQDASKGPKRLLWRYENWGQAIEGGSCTC